MTTGVFGTNLSAMEFAVNCLPYIGLARSFPRYEECLDALEKGGELREQGTPLDPQRVQLLKNEAKTHALSGAISMVLAAVLVIAVSAKILAWWALVAIGSIHLVLAAKCIGVYQISKEFSRKVDAASKAH